MASGEFTCDVLVGEANLRVRKIVLHEHAPTIVFLHDSLGCIKVWRDFPDRLCVASRCNGLIYDRQGYGESSPFTRPRGLHYLEEEADVLIRLLGETNGVGTSRRAFVLFGHSDGGSIALIAASKVGKAGREGPTAEAPFMVSGVITEGAHVFVEDITLDGIRAAVAHKDDLLPRIRKYHGDKSEAVFDAWASTWLKPEFRDFNMEHFLPDIKCPVLVIQGVDDEYGTEKQVEAISNQVSGRSEKFMVPGVGHTPHRDATTIVLAKAAEFVEQL